MTNLIRVIRPTSVAVSLSLMISAEAYKATTEVFLVTDCKHTGHSKITSRFFELLTPTFSVTACHYVSLPQEK